MSLERYNLYSWLNRGDSHRYSEVALRNIIEESYKAGFQAALIITGEEDLNESS